MGKPGRNDPCPCGSGQKYKRCCLEKDQAQRYQLPQELLNDLKAVLRTLEASSLPPRNGSAGGIGVASSRADETA